MGKAPAFQFYPMDWQRDMDEHPLEIKGAWITICCKLWWANQKGLLTLRPERWGTILRTNPEETIRIINYLLDEKIASGQHEANGYITVWNRRMVNDDRVRLGNKERQTRFREKGGGDPERWNAIRIRILEMDEYMCAYCGRRASSVDHIIPKSDGGNEDDDNLVACCKRCNMKKSNRTPMKAKMQFWDGFGRKTHLSQKYNINITPYSSSSSSSSTSIKNKDRGKRTAPFVPPCLSDISQYCRERKNAVDAQTFLDHYTSNGWMVGKNKMKDWRAAVRTWEKRQFEPPQKLNNNYTGAILQDSHILCPRCKKEILRADLEGEGCLHCDGKEIT